MSKFTDGTTLLIEGVKGKINQQGQLTDTKTIEDLTKFIEEFTSNHSANRRTKANCKLYRSRDRYY